MTHSREPEERSDMNKVGTRGCALACQLVLICLACVTTGCVGLDGTVTPADDEAYLRREFSIPTDIPMVSLWRSSDTPGWYGREGLRVVGEFQLSSAQIEGFAQASDRGWEPLPMPGVVYTVREPPEELPMDVEEGMFFCTLLYYGEWVDGEWQATGAMDSSVTVRCDDYLRMKETYGERFDHYRAGILDTDTGRMIVVLKNYY